MDLAQIRQLVIIAMFSDDDLLQQLTLKGGNALNLVYGFGSRVSVDIDLSMEGDFHDLAKTEETIFRGLRNRFGEAGLTVFDQKLTPRPTKPQPEALERFGGYEVTFKLMETARYNALPDAQRRHRESIVTGP